MPRQLLGAERRRDRQQPEAIGRRRLLPGPRAARRASAGRRRSRARARRPRPRARPPRRGPCAEARRGRPATCFEPGRTTRSAPSSPAAPVTKRNVRDLLERPELVEVRGGRVADDATTRLGAAARDRWAAPSSSGSPCSSHGSTPSDRHAGQPLELGRRGRQQRRVAAELVQHEGADRRALALASSDQVP